MDNEKLSMWQQRLSDSEASYSGELSYMDRRELIYGGRRELDHIVEGQKKESTAHVRNIAAELIESQINSNLPQPKVTPKRKADEWRAKIIEDMLRGELDRLPFEDLNDMQERTVPIQGGGVYLVEWDNTLRTHGTVGDVWVTVIHPKQLIPQDGITAGVEDMDYVIIKLPQTKEYIKRRYGIDISEESEEEPEVRGPEGESPSDELVTQYMAYYRNENGGIGLYSWVRDVELCDYDDYQTRRLHIDCGRIDCDRSDCSDCGAADGESFETSEFEELCRTVKRADGVEIEASSANPVKIPYYKPSVYPVVLQKNVSVFGRLLGDSDIDKIADQQNTTNVISADIIDKLLAGGSYLVLPDGANIKTDASRKKVIRPGNLADVSLIRPVDLTENIQYDLLYLSQVYEEARQIIGITDSFQGRRDNTATSGKAKQFAAAQSAGRLESKRVMKNAAYAKLFEIMFKFKLAYADEPRPVTSDDVRGDRVYGMFSRYDFLEQDDAGEWYYVDDFIFSVDSAAPLASNREAMWQETRLNLQSGSFGDPSKFETLILFWGKMEQLHYPGSAETKKFLEEQLRQLKSEANKKAKAQAGRASPGMAPPGGALPGMAPPGGALPGMAPPGGALPGMAPPGGVLPGGAPPGMASPNMSAQSPVSQAEQAQVLAAVDKAAQQDALAALFGGSKSQQSQQLQQRR